MTNKTLFKNANLIDGTGKIIEQGALLIEGENIKQVGTIDGIEMEDDVKVKDLTGQTIMPGMINSHVHCTMEPVGNPFELMTKESNIQTALRGVNNLQKYLQSGVTYFRDMGGPQGIDIELRKSLNQGLIQGPEFLASGKVITMTGGHGYPMGRECDGVAEVHKATREQLKAGANIIKIMATGGVMTEGVEPGSPQLTREEIAVAVREANKAGRRTATHAQGTTGIKNAILAGINSIEHGIFLDDEAIEMMIENNVYLVPTLVAPYFIIKNGAEGGIPEYAVEKSKRVMNSHIDSFQRAYQAGVKIAMGTDAGTPFNPHDMTAYELKLMVESGMKPMDAIISATKVAAELLEIDDNYGTLEAGKVADLIMIDESPLNNIEALLDVQQVYKKGKLVKG